jgi:hypothetical protein
LAFQGPDPDVVCLSTSEAIEPGNLPLKRIDAIRVAPPALPVAFPGIRRIGHRLAEPAQAGENLVRQEDWHGGVLFAMDDQQRCLHASITIEG